MLRHRRTASGKRRLVRVVAYLSSIAIVGDRLVRWRVGGVRIRLAG